MNTRQIDIYTPDNVAEQLAQMLAMDAKDFYENIAIGFYSISSDNLPIRAKTNFKQSVFEYKINNDGSKTEKTYLVSAFTHIDAIHDTFLNGSLFKSLIGSNKIKINDDHFRYGIIKEGIGFVPNIKIILEIIKAQMLSFRDPESFKDNRMYLKILINTAIANIDLDYNKQLLNYVPIMETPQLQNKFQILVSAMYDILAIKGNPDRKKSMLAACSFINDAVLDSNKYKENDLSWLSDQTFFLPNFIHKATLVAFQEQWEINYIKNNVNPFIDTVTSNKDKSKHSIKVIHEKMKEFIEYEAAKIIYSKNINLYNLMHYRNRFLGRVAELLFIIRSKALTEDYVKDILNRIVDELDKRLTKKQKFNN